ncbi:MAG TPA: hypothetical protein VHR45_17265 [Thermoanaerobaculia bacterium]|nr:hypothetical protein [Thermoanaerobaculia bacterium]
MHRNWVRVSLTLLLVALLAAPAAAEIFHVKLRNGALIDSRYKPEQASWDPNVVLLLSDEGNWIGIYQQDIENIEPESTVRGFGVQLNFNTVAIGWAPNDLPDAAAQPAGQPSSTADALQNFALQQAQATAHYSVPQFVQPEQASGVPPAFVGGYRAPQIPAPAPPPHP